MYINNLHNSMGLRSRPITLIMNLLVMNCLLKMTIATSTMEAGYSSLSMGMCNLLPIWHLAIEIGGRLDINSRDTTNICRATVHEDDQECLKLSRLDPGRMTWRSNFYAIKYHWFHSFLKLKSIVINFIESEWLVTFSSQNPRLRGSVEIEVLLTMSFVSNHWIRGS